MNADECRWSVMKNDFGDSYEIALAAVPTAPAN